MLSHSKVNHSIWCMIVLDLVLYVSMTIEWQQIELCGNLFILM